MKGHQPLFFSYNYMNAVLETPEVTVAPSAQKSDMRVVLDAFTLTASELPEKFNGNRLQKEKLRLYEGSIRYSRVNKVKSQEAVANLIRSLGEAVSIMANKQGNISFRFQVPQGYEAFSAVCKISDIRELHDPRPEIARCCYLVAVDRPTKNGPVKEFLCNAPNLKIPRTDIITFILDHERKRLVEWFAGSEKWMFPDTGGPEKYWALVGVDAFMVAREAMIDYYKAH